MTDIFGIEAAEEQKQENRCFVRLRTTMWADKTGVYTKKSLTYLRRLCVGYNLLAEDVTQISADKIIPNIVDLYKCKDGIYEVVSCNESRDFETGYIDDYDYKLIPFAAGKVGTMPKDGQKAEYC